MDVAKDVRAQHLPHNGFDESHPTGNTPSRSRRAPRFHPAWTMVAVAATALIAAGSFTTIAGLITAPLVESKGWSRTTVGAGVAVGMVLYGLVAPFSATMMDRYGVRRVTASALALLVASAILTVTATPSAPWFILWWGVSAGLGTGSLTMVFGATIADRWFHRKIGFATGLLTAASVVGQFAILPLLSVTLARTDWRGAVLACGFSAAVALICVLAFLREDPHSVGASRYGATEERDADRPRPGATADPFARTVTALLTCLKDRRFWILALMFALCGATTNGLMWSHFTPAAHDHGITATVASSMLAIIGFANILGTLTAGRLTDSVDPRRLLALFFLGRAVALALLPLSFTTDLIAFAVVFGILDVATVPPTLALCRHYFGDAGAQAFGWVNVFHQIGAGAMALGASVIRDVDGSYTPVWIVSACACLVAACLGATTSAVRPTSG
ncbi:MFS transporter [Nocardia noduli]|uniref:MFS transporter n=1 Tax=Nocardia noduli TaxID=2815722 RepID=UPI001C22975A|nr:MFS transporter [Nocardia noduli]